MIDPKSRKFDDIDEKCPFCCHPVSEHLTLLGDNKWTPRFCGAEESNPLRQFVWYGHPVGHICACNYLVPEDGLPQRYDIKVMDGMKQLLAIEITNSLKGVW